MVPVVAGSSPVRHPLESLYAQQVVTVGNGLAASLCSALLLAGTCAVDGRSHKGANKLPPCATGVAAPVTVPMLIRRFAARGIAMRPFRPRLCEDMHVVAQIWNWDLKVSAARQRAAESLHGAIECELYDSLRTETLQRLTFAHGRTAAVFMISNVSCTVYPSFQIYVGGGPDHHREQDRAVEPVVRLGP